MSRIIIANIIGGLGNQMFQYACARACAEKVGATLLLATDMFRNYSLHQGFELQNIFSISSPVCPANTLKEILGWRTHPEIRRFLARFRSFALLDGKGIFEPHLHYWEGLEPRVFKSCYLHGYWQSERYFQEASEIIRKEFIFREILDEENASVLRQINSCPSASIHIRRGDYVKSSNHILCSSHYYNAAIELLQNQIPDIRFFVFSDDVHWVQETILPKHRNMVIIDHNRNKQSFKDMWLMSNCDHHIIANSSFSWWGAWLNSKSNKIVIAPHNWFTNGINSKDLVPDNWIKLQFC